MAAHRIGCERFVLPMPEPDSYIHALLSICTVLQLDLIETATAAELQQHCYNIALPLQLCCNHHQLSVN
jgi:hypothetical protein